MSPERASVGEFHRLSPRHRTNRLPRKEGTFAETEKGEKHSGGLRADDKNKESYLIPISSAILGDTRRPQRGAIEELYRESINTCEYRSILVPHLSDQGAQED